MKGGLSLWHLMSGIPVAQCDALNTECQAQITAIAWPPYSAPFKFQSPAQHTAHLILAPKGYGFTRTYSSCGNFKELPTHS